MEYAVIFLPLAGSILGFIGKSLIKYFSEITTSLFVSISAVFSMILFWNGIQNSTYGNFKIFEKKVIQSLEIYTFEENKFIKNKL